MRCPSRESLGVGLVAFCLTFGSGCDRAVQWERSYGGPDVVEPVAVIRAPDSGYALLANITDKWTRAEGVWLLRLDDEGGTLWTRSFIIGGHTEADDIIPFSDGGFAVSGRTDASEGSRPFLAAVRADGEVVTTHTWLELSGSGPCRMADAAEGTVVMTGDQRWSSVLVQRATPTGYVVWASTCSLESEHPWIGDIARLDSDGYFICGSDFGLGVSSTGEKLWSRNYGSLGAVGFRVVAAANDSGLFLAGSVYTDKGARIICARVTRTGEIVWSRRVDDPPADGRSVCASRDGGCYVGGGTDETDSDDGILIKLDADGNVEWQREFNGPEYGVMTSVTETPEGYVMLLHGAGHELHVLKLKP